MVGLNCSCLPASITRSIVNTGTVHGEKMLRSPQTLLVYGLIALLLIVVSASAQGAVYKYKQDGVWHFTDNPGEVPASQRTPSAHAPGPAGTDLKRQLVAALNPVNDIETATLATVAIETSFGYGSGFFVSADGYILTNKHVIRQTGGPGTQDDPAAASTAEALDRYDAQIEVEMRRLQQARDDLAQFRRFIDGQAKSPSRAYNETRYQ